MTTRLSLHPKKKNKKKQKIEQAIAVQWMDGYWPDNTNNDSDGWMHQNLGVLRY